MGKAAVRPTRRCLSDMGLALPPLTIPLHELPQPLLQKAQQLPEKHFSGGAERVLCLSDRVWFKVKRGERERGAATLLSDADLDAYGPSVPAVARWWLGAYGTREAGSRGDFYEALKAEAFAKSVDGEADSGHLLPSLVWDWKRLELELGLVWITALKRLVLRLVAKSLRDGHEYVGEAEKYRISALVRADDGHDAYLSIFAEGIPDPQVIALILDSVPGLDHDDWQYDYSGPGHREPAPGDLVYSTILPPQVCGEILDAVPAEDE